MAGEVRQPATVRLRRGTLATHEAPVLIICSKADHSESEWQELNQRYPGLDELAAKYERNPKWVAGESSKQPHMLPADNPKNRVVFLPLNEQRGGVATYTGLAAACAKLALKAIEWNVDHFAAGRVGTSGGVIAADALEISFMAFLEGNPKLCLDLHLEELTPIDKPMGS